MPRAKSYLQLYHACRKGDAEAAGFALLLEAVDKMEAGEPPPDWARALVGELIKVKVARVRKGGSEEGDGVGEQPAAVRAALELIQGGEDSA